MCLSTLGTSRLSDPVWPGRETCLVMLRSRTLSFRVESIALEVEYRFDQVHEHSFCLPCHVSTVSIDEAGTSTLAGGSR